MLIKLSKMFLCLMLACTMSFTMGCGGDPEPTKPATDDKTETKTDEGSDEGSSDEDDSSEDDTDDSGSE